MFSLSLFDPSQGHRTAGHRKTRKEIDAPSGIQIRDLSISMLKTFLKQSCRCGPYYKFQGSVPFFNSYYLNRCVRNSVSLWETTPHCVFSKSTIRHFPETEDCSHAVSPRIVLMSSYHVRQNFPSCSYPGCFQPSFYRNLLSLLHMLHVCPL